MEDYFPSEESDNEPEYFNDINDQKKYLRKLQSECINYEEVIKNLENEKKEREDILQQTQAEIEELQRDILYHDLNIEKAVNVVAELDNLNEDKANLDKIEKQNELENINDSINTNLTKYINRVMYTKKFEFEEKLEKKKNQYQAVCIKFYREDPTDEDYGAQNAQNYSFQVFGLSNDLTFEQLINLAKEHWNIKEIGDYVLTDQDHHDLVLLNPVPIVQYLTHENTGYAFFVLRPKNTKMKELVSTQKVGIMLVQETEKQGKLKEEFKKIFALLRKAKPGIKTYETNYEENEKQVKHGDGTFLNFLMLLTVFILMILSLVEGGIQPADAREFNAFVANYTPPGYYASPDDFYKDVVYMLYDYNSTSNKPINLHYVPIGVRRIIMNKMLPISCTSFNGTSFCTYDDLFSKTNTDKTPLANTTEGPWKYYTTVPEDQKLNIDGQASFFDGSGFIYDYPVDKTKDQANDLLQNVLKMGSNGNYFGDNSRAFIITSMYFEPNRHVILERALMFEFMSSGIVQITDKKSYFRPSTVDSKSSEHMSIDLGLLIATIVGFFLNIVYNLYKTRKLKELIALRTLIKYVIVALVISYFAVYHNRPDKSLQEILDTKTFQTLAIYGERRQSALTYLIIAFFLHSLTIIRSFVFSRTVNVFLSIFAQSYKDFLSFLLLFFSAFIGFSFVWWIAFGPYTQNLQTLISTAFEIFLYFATGNTLTVSPLFSINEVWAVLLVITTCFIIFIQLDALMMSLIQENVRQLYLKTKPNSGKTPLRGALDKIKTKALAVKTKVFGFFSDPRKRRR